jgi:hypothetical protein
MGPIYSMDTARQNPNVAGKEDSAPFTNYIYISGGSEGYHASYADVRTV